MEKNDFKIQRSSREYKMCNIIHILKEISSSENKINGRRSMEKIHCVMDVQFLLRKIGNLTICSRIFN